MCKTKFLQMCSFSIILTSLHSLNLSFLFHLDSLHCHPVFPNYLHLHSDSRLRFRENSCFSSKTKTPLYYYCKTLATKSLFTSSETSLVILPKRNYLKKPKI